MAVYSLDVLLSQFWTCCFMPSSNYCFLSFIQVPQDIGNMLWYSHLIKNILQFVVIHTGKGFSIISETEVDVFLELPCFLYDPLNVGNFISSSSAFLKPSLYSWKFWGQILLKPDLKDFEDYLACMWNEWNCMIVWTIFGIALCDWNENWPLPVLWPFCISQVCWHTECST